MASVPFEQPISTDLPHHFRCVTIGQRGHAKTDVAQHFHVDPAQAKSYEGTEQGVLRNPYHDLNAADYHWLDQHAFHRLEVVLLGQTALNLTKGLTDCEFVRQI